MADFDEFSADTTRLLSLSPADAIEAPARASQMPRRRACIGGAILLAGGALVYALVPGRGHPEAVADSAGVVGSFGLPPPPKLGLPSMPWQRPGAAPGGINPAMQQQQMAPKEPTGPQEMNFHMFRAGGPVAYQLDNVNTASLEGVMWYLHSEVVPSAPRKYGIDRIRRYEVTVKNTQEYWNVHKKNFGPFMAFDAGECPQLGIPQDDIDANNYNQDVGSFKTLDCRMRMPGGLCEHATGSPDCTFSVWPAGEVFLDELIGITDYNAWWNTSYEACITRVNNGLETGPCQKNFEYVVDTDAGVGTSFWDGRLDEAACKRRVDTVKALFEAKYPGKPAENPSPPCDFDMIYENEMTWPIKHDGVAQPSPWWTYKDGGDVPADVQAKFNTPAPAAIIEPNPNEPDLPQVPQAVPAPADPNAVPDEAAGADAYADPADPYAEQPAEAGYGDAYPAPAPDAAYPAPADAYAAYPAPAPAYR